MNGISGRDPPSELFLRLFCFLIWILAVFSPDRFGSQATRLPQTEVDALRAIQTKLRKTDWDFNEDPCGGNGTWSTPPLFEGHANTVTCNCTRNNTACHVVSIQLKSQNLTGVLPEELSNLTELRVFDVVRNYINGTIPAGWGSLPLVNLSLMGNRLSGRVPKEIGNISTLEGFVIESNSLEGMLPAELGKLNRLRRLFLNSNKFTGELPSTFSNLTSITEFWIGGSNISGKIPDFIDNWIGLSRLMITGTSMEGPIPSSISALTNLTQLRITDLCGPDSTFPLLVNMKNLKELVLRNCSISGEIPQYIWSIKNLQILDLSFNNLTGQIPQTISLASTLVMFLRNNNLTGTVPDWILHASDASNKFDLSENSFTGAIASSCQPGNLNLICSHSSTDEKVAACFKKDYPCSGLAKYFSLFINCGGDEYVFDGKKYESDMRPSAQTEYYISGGGNWAFTSTGAFMDINGGPYLVSNTSKLYMNNPELYMTARGSPMSLTYYGLCLQKGTYLVQLHFSEIMFSDDRTFSSLGERLFDVYLQHERVLENFNIAFEAGGPNKEVVKKFNATVTTSTLQIGFYWAGKGTLALPRRGVYGPLISAISVTPNFVPFDYDSPKYDKHTLPITIIIVVIVASFVIILVIVFETLRVKGCLRGSESENEEIEGPDLNTGCSSFTLKQIKAATNNFDPVNKLGEGGFGPVYKGTLSDGTAIAVKQLSAKSRQGTQEFLTEIAMISALQHPNLVKLLGCSVEGRQLLLVYEYMENNSLAHALFGAPDIRLKMDWLTRYKICFGIARGLAYLHEESAIKVVHRDIKATNILLDKDLNAKISDFGLAKLDEGDTHISTRIAGTIGYMAPEYATRGYLTDKADVYSFGVLMLEIVSGQSNTHFNPTKEGPFLLDQAYVLQEKGRLTELVDPSLRSNYSKEEVLTMLNVALLCTSTSLTLRPKMSLIVDMLEGRTPVYQAPIGSVTPNKPFSIGEGSNILSDYSTIPQSGFGQGGDSLRARSEEREIISLTRSVAEQSSAEVETLQQGQPMSYPLLKTDPETSTSELPIAEDRQTIPLIKSINISSVSG